MILIQSNIHCCISNTGCPRLPDHCFTGSLQLPTVAMAREQLEILHGEIFDRNVEHKVIDKCDTLIGILKEIKIKREDMDAIIDVRKMI